MTRFNAPSLLSALTLTSQNINSRGPISVPAAPAGSATCAPHHLAEMYQGMLKRFGEQS